MKKIQLLFFALLLVITARSQTVTINVNNVGNHVPPEAVGICVSYPNDDDKYYNAWRGTKTHASVYSEMKVKTLRFPMGGLAENYLWHKPGEYSTAINGLKPQVAAKNSPPYMKVDDENICPPTGSRWTEFTNDDGSMVADASLDFDEYIALCTSIGADPVVMVNSFGHKLCGSTLTRAQIIESAKEWVKYSNITRGYNVKYWEIGNEVSSIINSTTLKHSAVTITDFKKLFNDMAAAMKSVDPTIKVGAGLGFDYFQESLGGPNGIENNVDFFVAHQYARASQTDTYEDYRDLDYVDLNYIIKANDAINGITNQTNKNRIKILVTEFGSTPSDGWLDSTGVNVDKSNNVFKSLFEFDMMLLALKNYDRVDRMHNWVSHSPFSSRGKGNNHSNILDSTLSILPQGKVLQIFNTYKRSNMLNFESKHQNGKIQIYGMKGTQSNSLTLFFINKKKTTEVVDVSLQNYTGSLTAKQCAYKSAVGDAYDTQPILTSQSNFNAGNGNFNVSLPPVSIKIITFDNLATQSSSTGLNGFPIDNQLEHQSTELSVYPNPVTDVLNIRNARSDDKFKIINMSGKVEITQQGGSQINVSSLTPGTYFLITADGKRNIKFIKN